MLNGQIYVASSDGSFTRRTFDGSTYGAPVAVDTQDELTPLTDWRSDIQAATGMFYDSGRIYFTRSGSNQLFYRYFTPQSDVVGAKRFVASGNVAGIDFTQVRGMFTTGTVLYWAKPDGSLSRITWQDGALSDVPVGGTASQVSGPGIDSNLWAARTLFLYQDQNGAGTVPVGNRPPTASFTSSCSQLLCQFNATGSSDPDGNPLTYSWAFGDGGTGTGVTPSHTYGTAGPRTVTLTVNDGTVNASTTGQVNPTVSAVALEYVGAASTSGNRTNHTATIPAGVQAGDTLVMFLTTNATTSTVNNAVPGWTLLQSQDGNAVRGRAWTRTATGTDAGTAVTVTTSQLAKSTLAVAAYRGSGPATSQVSASASTVVNTAATSHTTPPVTVNGANSWLVSVWSEKSSTDTTWTAPAGTPVRTEAEGTGSGKVSVILGDSNGPVSTGTAAGRTATTSTSVGRSVLFSVVVTPQ
jgi:PKD repeat protein